MKLAIIHSRANAGMHAPLVSIETHISGGLPNFSIVGLPETTVKESRDRVRSALMNANFEFPYRRITVNLAPADLPKDGSRFDLPIALGILVASGQLPYEQLTKYEFAGELALSGELRPVHAILPFAIATQRARRQLILPHDNGAEATLVGDVEVFAAHHLLEVCAHLTGVNPLPLYKRRDTHINNYVYPDLSDVKGQQHAKRALEIAAAGGHSLLLMGPPGTGKSMLASRIPGILPQLTQEEAVEVASVISFTSKKLELNEWRKRPFRAPHHTASSVALVGGGTPPQPGEISLAHQGILFLDELPEFARRSLEALREPLETGVITISRAAKQVEFPARFQLIAAMNPCPCGYSGDQTQNCHCTPEQIKRYRTRISGPLLDRIDMHVEVPRIYEEMLLQNSNTVETSEKVRARVEKTRAQQLARMNVVNARLSEKQVEVVCLLSKSVEELLRRAIKQLQLSARSYHRILRVARTIADLADQENIAEEHIKEALNYRRLTA